MHNLLLADASKTNKKPLTSSSPNFLQRTCACGQHTTAGGDCTECRKKRLSLQRRPAEQATQNSVPPIAHEVLRSPGQPLDEETRSFMEERFSQDFSRIPAQASVHRNIQASLKNNALGDQSWGEYAPGGTCGKKPIASKPIHTNHGHYTLTLPSRGAGNEPSTSPISSSVPETALETAEPQEAATDTASETTTTTSASTALRWQHVKRHRWDALWYFCGEHPAGFSTRATLRAEGFTNPNNVEWFVRQGADKVYAPGGFYGPEITLHSSAGSQRPGDIHIEVQERMPDGTVNNYLGYFTVRKPHRLRQEWTSDHTSCPPWSLSPASCPAFWTQISYRIVDNVGGTIVGATVNERFPGPAVDDQPNHWRSATVTSGSSWPRTNGTFTDNLYMCCGIPAPVLPGSSQWSDKVYHEPQEFYVGSTTSGNGCRVQVHTMQFYRGFADHENIRSPAP